MGRCTVGIAEGILNGIVLGFCLGGALYFARTRTVQLTPMVYEGIYWAKPGAVLFGALGALRYCFN